MQFGLTDDQRVLQEESRRFFADVAPRARRCDPGTWALLTRLGWQAVAIEPDAAGSGGGLVDLAVVLAEAGKVALALPLLSTAGLAGSFLAKTGDAGKAYRAQIGAGETASLAFHGTDGFGLEPGGGVALDARRLTGVRSLVTDARHARWVVVPVVEGGEERLAVVESTSGWQSDEVEGMDGSRPLSRVTFDETPVADILPIDLAAASAAANTAVSAELLGVAEGALAEAVAYALEREQFGQRIGAFQAIKHKLADCYVGIERARSLVYAAAMVCDDREADPRIRSRMASMAKAAAGEAALAATAADVQIHGAIAVTTEHGAIDLLRRARQASALLGTHLSHLEKVGRSYVQEVSSGHS
jgi:alkylation response protein AidB-like acyl-CoA dehydrogenase